MFRKVSLVVLAGILVTVCAAEASSKVQAKRLYRESEKCLENGENHRAFLILREIAREHPSSEYADDAHFLIAHYYIQNKNYFQAENELMILTKNYPESPFVDDAKIYFSKMRSRGLEDKVIDVMNNGDYKTAKIFLDEMLSIDPDNKFAKSRLADVENILVKMDNERRQLEEAKERIEEDSLAIKKARVEVSQLRDEALKAMRKAEKLNDETIADYERQLAEAKEREVELETQIASLTVELDEWRGRAKKYGAQVMSGDGNESTVKLASQDQTEILFEGPGTDPDPCRKEQIAASLLEEKSPTVLLLSETKNDLTNMMKVELVLSLDLHSYWAEGYYLKFRMDYESTNGTPEQKPTVIYYTTADMDEIDTESCIYKKKVIVAIDSTKVSSYTPSAFFVERK